MVVGLHDIKNDLWQLMQQIADPEIPVLSIVDLGIVRQIDVQLADGNPVGKIIITPTYSGCPAMDMIAANIKMVLLANGYDKVGVQLLLSPAWTTDWMSESGKKKLKEYGIAPPNAMQQVCHQEMFVPNEAVQCPRCNSYHTATISQFGSTACKALYQCLDCREPFDYFKCH